MMEAASSVGSSTVICVRLFGPLEVSRRRPDGSWQIVKKDEWNQGTPPRSVLKRLLTTPGRRLARSDIEDDLWPDAGMELADRNLSNALMVIRRVIGKDLVETAGPLCGLVGQSQIWTDLDACALLLKQAENRGCTTPQALPLLEEALSYLERGKCLEDESEIWCHAVRTDAERMCRQVRVWLAESYEKAGKFWQAGEVYRAMTRATPGDEEALKAWIQMLARCAKIQEARACYQEVKNAWEGQGFVLSKKAEELAVSIERMEDVNRRNATKRIGAFAGGLLFTAHQLFSPANAGELLYNEEILSICAANIPVLWQLYFDGHFAEVQQALPEYIPQLTFLAQRPTYQKRAASLISKALQLTALMEKHVYNSGNALLYAQQGEYYGQLAKNPNLQIASLIQQANIYLDLSQTWRELQAYKRAYRLYQEVKRNSEISPLLVGRVYIGLAKSYGKFGEYKKRALGFLEMAHKIYPAHPETDAAFDYSCHTRFTLLNHTSLTYLNIGQLEQALSTFEQVSAPVTLVPRKLEFLIRRSMIFFALNDLEQACNCTSLAATSSKALGSDLRYNEAYNIYERMLRKWPQERRVKTLADCFC